MGFWLGRGDSPRLPAPRAAILQKSPLFAGVHDDQIYSIIAVGGKPRTASSTDGTGRKVAYLWVSHIYRLRSRI